MSQCVPNWDMDDGLPHQSTTTTHAPMSDYVVSELTWEKGHVASHGHRGGPLRRDGKLSPHKHPSPGAPSWEKPPASDTLEAVVDQANRVLVPAAVDALVPSTRVHPDGGEPEQYQPARVVPDSAAARTASTAGGMCGGRKRARAGAGDGCRSATVSAGSVGSASPVEGSPETENASWGRALTAVSEGDDSWCSRRQSQDDGSDEEEKSKNDKGRRSSISTKRIRAAAVHNQSERKRRDRINQRMRTLQKLVPNSSKTDKASILDEVIDYMKQLQSQVQMMNRMNSMPHMMMPMPMAMQQLQMAMMTQMAQMAQMGMAMGMGMADVGPSGMPWPPFLHPSAPRDVPGREPTQPTGGAFLPDPFAAFMAFQTQPSMASTDPHSMMAALNQQLQHQQPPGSGQETRAGTA